MTGESTLFAREDYVEEAWRIVRSSTEKEHADLSICAQHMGP